MSGSVQADSVVAKDMEASKRINLPSYTTTLRDAIPNPKAGLLIFNSTTSKLNFYTGSGWEAVTSA